MSDNKSTRDIVIELKGIMGQYMEASKDRRQAIDENFKMIREERERLEDRVHCVEKKVWTWTGAVGAVNFIFTLILNYLTGTGKHQ